MDRVTGGGIYSASTGGWAGRADADGGRRAGSGRDPGEPVNPSITRTPPTSGTIRTGLDGGETHRLALAGAMTPGRSVEPDEAAHVVAFLMSGHASCVTGRSLMVDGGQRAT